MKPSTIIITFSIIGIVLFYIVLGRFTYIGMSDIKQRYCLYKPQATICQMYPNNDKE